MTKSEAYRIFGLSLNQPVTLDLLKNRYRILTRTYHPDNPKTGSEEMMAKVNLAFDALRTFSFDPESDSVREARRGTGFAQDFNPDFTPFEYGSRDESYYENNRRYEEEHQQRYERYHQYDADEQVSDVDDDAEFVPVHRHKKAKKRGVLFYLGKFIAIIIKFLIIIAVLGCFGAAAIAIWKFGMGRIGIMLAVSAVVMSGLFVLAFKFFSDLTSWDEYNLHKSTY